MTGLQRKYRGTCGCRVRGLWRPAALSIEFSFTLAEYGYAQCGTLFERFTFLDSSSSFVVPFS